MNLSAIKIVLLPGLDGTGDLFAGLISALPPQLTAEPVRYPSDVTAYADLMPLLVALTSKLGPYVLVAESFSTPLAIQFAATHPPNLSGLILCAGFASSPLGGYCRQIASLTAPMLLRLPLPDLMVKAFLVGAASSPALRSTVRAAIGSVQPEVLAARLRQVLTCDATSELQAIAVPLLYLRAREDRLVPKSKAEEIRRIKPDATIVDLHGPHFLLQRFPEEAATIIRRFVQGLS